jgi:hypothetical protein
MPRLALLLLLGLFACSSNEPSASHGSVPMQGWRTQLGKVPTQAEFAAVVASCQDRAKSPGGSLNSCLTDMGLRRSQ